MSQVFISYPHQVFDFTKNELVTELQKANLTVWWDSQIPVGHKDWREIIDEEILAAQVVIVVITPDALVSEYVTYEWAYALGLNKVIIPIIHTPTALHSRLRTYQTPDFTQVKNRPWDELLAAVRKAIADDESRKQPVMIPKLDLMTALTDLLFAEEISHTSLNAFLQQDLLDARDIAEITRSARATTPNAG